MISVPSWLHDRVWYQIFPDRFAKSHKVMKPAHLEQWHTPPTYTGFKGGDLIGVVERLDYLCNLGVNGIYLNPIFSSAANHRYHTFDYFQVDPILGGNVAFRTFLDECHRRDVKVMLDGVFNHASRGFYQFHHTLENLNDSPYQDWFHFNQSWLHEGRTINPYPGATPNKAKSSLDRFGYEAWWGLPALPKFNTDNPEVREFLFSVATFWAEQGIDGWRLDVPNEIDDDQFWQTFRQRVRAINPNIYILGEIWGDARRWLQGDQFDGVMNYLLSKAIVGFVFHDSLNYEELRRCGYDDVKPLSPTEFVHQLQNLNEMYSHESMLAMLNILGSHDTPRILNMGQGDYKGVMLAMDLMFFAPGTPCVYYGDEIGMAGNHDPDCRRGFEWDETVWDDAILSHVKSWAHLRQQSEILQTAPLTILSQGDREVVGLRRQIGKEHFTLLLNSSNTLKTIPLDAYFSDEKITQASGEPISNHDAIEISPRSSVLLKV